MTDNLGGNRRQMNLRALFDVQSPLLPQSPYARAILALVYLGFAVAVGPWAVAALFVVYAGFYGLTEGAERALTLELAGMETGTGTALGAFHLATGLGTFGASLLFGALWQLASPATAFLTGATLAGAAALLLGGLGRNR